MITKLKEKVKDWFDELKRVDWPDKKKVMSSTYTVVLTSIFVGFYLAGADWVFSWLLKFVVPK